MISKRLIILIFLSLASPVWALGWELSPYWGPYIGDTVSTSHISGVKAGLRWTESLSTAVDFGYSRLEVDPQGAYGSTVTSRHYYHLNGSLTGSLPASLKVSERKKIDMDLYGTIGGGWLSINRTNLGNGFFGVGSLFYLRPWVALRAEARTYLYKLPIPQGGFSVDAAFLVGPTFMFGGSRHRRPQAPF